MQYVCTLLAACGCLRPASWTSPSKRIAFHVYAIVVWTLIHILSISQILDLIINVDNQNDFSENLYITLGVFGSCIKMCHLLLTQRNIETLIDTLQKKPFVPTNAEEIEIQTRFNKVTERNAIAYTIIIECYVASLCMTSFFTDFRHKKLFYRVWLPYDYSSSLSFTVTYVHQIVALAYCSFFTVACDSLFNSFLIHIYCHFEILEHRLKSIKKDKTVSAKQFATMLNKEFQVIMFSQTVISMTVLCFSLYELTQRELNSKMIERMVYSVNTLLQIFYYYWYGNEVRLKSLEVPKMIFESNWISLDNGTKRILLMIMRRATIPIEFSSLHIVTMNLNTFMTLLKTSYSAYTLLQ